MDHLIMLAMSCFKVAELSTEVCCSQLLLAVVNDTPCKCPLDEL